MEQFREEILFEEDFCAPPFCLQEADPTSNTEGENSLEEIEVSFEEALNEAASAGAIVLSSLAAKPTVLQQKTISRGLTPSSTRLDLSASVRESIEGALSQMIYEYRQTWWQEEEQADTLRKIEEEHKTREEKGEWDFLYEESVEDYEI